MTVLRFVPVALVLLLAGVAAVLLATAHLVVGVAVAVPAVALLALVVWARRVAPGEVKAVPYVESERELY